MAVALAHELIDRLDATMRAAMLREMPPDPSGRLRGMRLWDVTAVYANWRARFPAALPRRVHVSPALLANPLRRDYGDGLAAVLREIALGGDLRPRLSTAVRTAYVPPVAAYIARRPFHGRDRDPLLADWGVHHLHLGTEPGKLPEFVRRTPHVLFVAFRGAEAYLIDLRAHEPFRAGDPGDNWAAMSILETMVRTWPDADLVWRAGSVLGIEGGNRPDESRRALREAGVTLPAEVDGKVYVPFGQNTAGGSFASTRHAMRVHWDLQRLRDHPDRLDTLLAPAEDSYGLAREGWVPWVRDDAYGFRNGAYVVPLGSLVP